MASANTGISLKCMNTIFKVDLSWISLKCIKTIFKVVTAVDVL